MTFNRKLSTNTKQKQIITKATETNKSIKLQKLHKLYKLTNAQNYIL